MVSPMARARFPFDVLVVDDDEDIRDLMVSFFHDRSMPVTAAHDGRAAVLALERSAGRYGLVVTDVNLPGVNGFAVLEAARRANASCYVIVVTGYASLDSALQAVRGGAYDYLPKPFSLGQLDVILTRIADRTALENENRRLLSHRGGAAMSSAAPAGLDERLAAIEASLTRLEAALGLDSERRPFDARVPAHRHMTAPPSLPRAGRWPIEDPAETPPHRLTPAFGGALHTRGNK